MVKGERDYDTKGASLTLSCDFLFSLIIIIIIIIKKTKQKSLNNGSKFSKCLKKGSDR